jgi:CRP/FNR family cyclic AMP-dependent transcriptional regulator
MVDPQVLGGLELFVDLPDRALAAIGGVAEVRRYAAGEIIFSPETASDRAFLLLRGSVRLTVHASSLPQPVALASLETPGQAFGFSTVIGQTHHNSSAEAVTEVEAVALDGPKFLAYLEKDPEVGFVVMKRVARALSRRLATLRRHLLETIIDYERPPSTIPEN